MLTHGCISRRKHQMTRMTGTSRRQTQMLYWRLHHRVRARRSTTDTSGYAVMERTMLSSVCRLTLFVATGMNIPRLQPWLHYCATTVGSSLATFATENSGTFPRISYMCDPQFFVSRGFTARGHRSRARVCANTFVFTSTHLYRTRNSCALLLISSTWCCMLFLGQ